MKVQISQNQTSTLFSSKSRGFVILLLPSSGKEQELGPISRGRGGGVGIDPKMAGAMSRLSICRLLQEWGEVCPACALGGWGLATGGERTYNWV